MPFFYSQYLKDSKKPPKGSEKKNAASRLIWHSNTGATGRKSGSNFKPLKYKSDGPKCVHFSTIEVQHFHFDWSLADSVFYTRKELTAMGEKRFDDATILRQQRNLDQKMGDSVDDLDMTKKTRPKDINSLLNIALDDEDADETVSIRGIEHFVYPELQQEMIRKKKEQQAEVLDFVRSKRPDPQGWRLARHSRTYSQWARDVALQKGMKYRMNLSSVSVEDRERLQSAASLQALTSSASFSAASFSEHDRS